MQLEGSAQLIEWTAGQPAGGSYLWWELAAGGISCLAIHALFAELAAGVSPEEGRQIDAAYFPPVCAISALLDSLIDQAKDSQTDNHSFMAHYETRALAARRFAEIAEEARALMRPLRRRRQHGVILAGIASFYLSAGEAQSQLARPVTRSTLESLGSLTAPLLAVMRLMRRNHLAASRSG